MHRLFCLIITSATIIGGFYGPALAQVDESAQSIRQAFENETINRETKVLYQLYAGLQVEKLPAAYQSPQADQPIKCGTPPLMEYHQHSNEFSATAARQIEQMVGNTQAQQQQTYNSPSGQFVVMYATSGPDAVPTGDTNANSVPDYVEVTAQAADSSWNHQVNTLGFSNPVVGSTDPYPIFIEDLGASGFFGFTSTGGNRGFANSTYIVINSQLDEPGFTNNDDQNPTEGAVKVTVVHELKHAVQFANSQWYSVPENNGPHSLDWAEMDATFMEEVVYDNVNDYYNYIDGSESIFLDNVHTLPVAYSGVSWFIYFMEQLETQFWVDVWDRIRQRFAQQQGRPNPDFLSMLGAITQTLNETYDQSLDDAFTLSHLWHYASGAKAAPDFGFSERNNYPTPHINYRLAPIDSLRASGQIISPLSAEYVEVEASNIASDNVRVNLSSSASAGLGLLAYFNDGSTDFALGTTSGSNTLELRPGWEWSRINSLAVVAANVHESQSVTYTLEISSTVPDELRLNPNFPNPFSQSTTIPILLPETADVEVKIYNAAGRLVETLVDRELPAGLNPISFNARNLASGVYFYQVVIEGDVRVEKMTIIK
jgi:hypothetical protein